MVLSKVSSLSDADSRLAALNTEILALEIERSSLLAQELENAQGRVAEIQAFIGVYQASSALGGDAPAPSQASSALGGDAPAPRQRAAKKKGVRGRPPGTAKKRAAKEKSAGAGTRQRRVRGDNTERVAAVTSLVKASGSEGISARKVANETGFPYGTVLKLMNTNPDFQKVGEKRNRRYFMA